MTGFGEAHSEQNASRCLVELRGVNNRHFKLTVRCPDALQVMEADLERLLREKVARGSLSLSIRLESANGTNTPRINGEVVASYYTQLRTIETDLKLPQGRELALADLLPLPGVLQTGELHREDLEQLWPLVEATVRTALEKFQQFRVTEGAAMAADLRENCRKIAGQLEEVVVLGPQVVADYRDRLHQRIAELLRATEVQLNPGDLLREVALFADRCDISEEITRLRSHIDQFVGLLEAGSSQGRKLDFLCQEMFREANTIGSKSNNSAISIAAVEIKTVIERIREVVQNVE